MMFFMVFPFLPISPLMPRGMGARHTTGTIASNTTTRRRPPYADIRKTRITGVSTVVCSVANRASRAPDTAARDRKDLGVAAEISWTLAQPEERQDSGDDDDGADDIDDAVHGFPFVLCKPDQ
ncbi:MAG: hypothetical protein ABWZ29_00750 [Casimicrobiaceae bacterium]